MATKRELSKEKTIAAILQAAASEFAEHGYNKTTIRSIASKAGVASGLVCTYFDSKENLLDELVRLYRPNTVYENLRNTEPHDVLCAYLNHIRDLQKNDPDQFRLHLKIASMTDFPETVTDVIRKGFEGSVIENAILAAQKRGQIVPGDPFRVFMILSGSGYVLLNQFSEMGTEAPDNDAILNIIGYQRESGTDAGTDASRGSPEEDPDRMFADIAINDETLPLITRMRA